MRRYLPLVLFVVLLATYGLSRAVSGAPISPHAAGNSAASQGTDQSPLSISKRGYPDPVIEGRELELELTVYNGGTVPLTGVVVSDTVPVGTSFRHYSSDCPIESGGVVYCPDLVIPAGAKRSVWIPVWVGIGVTQVVNDQYGAGAPGVPPVTGEPIAVRVVTPTPASYPGPTVTLPPTPGVPPTTVPTEPPIPSAKPQLVISQDSPSGAAGPGEEQVLRIVVTNEGTGAARDVILAVQLPPGLEVQGVSISPAAANEWTGRILWVAWGVLDPGAAAMVELRILVVPGAAGEVDVIASLPDYGVESRAAVDVRPQVLPGTGVPITPLWGWAALAGALLIGGLLLLRRGK